jgi:hypothetical protein
MYMHTHTCLYMYTHMHVYTYVCAVNVRLQVFTLCAPQRLITCQHAMSARYPWLLQPEVAAPALAMTQPLMHFRSLPPHNEPALLPPHQLPHPHYLPTGMSGYGGWEGGWYGCDYGGEHGPMSSSSASRALAYAGAHDAKKRKLHHAQVYVCVCVCVWIDMCVRAPSRVRALSICSPLPLSAERL